jgi:hypothetical protein
MWARHGDGTKKIRYPSLDPPNDSAIYGPLALFW